MGKERRREYEGWKTPFDKVVYRYSDGGREFAHATGYEVQGDDGIWRYEYVDSEGNFHY